jgi:flagellar biosynthetic protein FlhB
MADETEDKSSKTEEPTERKLKKLREEGNVPKSKEVNNFFMIMGMIGAMILTIPLTLGGIQDIFGSVLSDAGHVHLTSSDAIGNYMMTVTAEGSKAILPTLGILALFAAFGSFIQTGFLFSFKPIQPKLSKISLIKGMERMFSVKSLMEFLKSVFKLVVLTFILFGILYIERNEFLLLVDKSVGIITSVTQTMIIRMLLGTLAIVFLLAVIDFIFQRAQFTKEQRMSRKELKDEFKESEGDPFIKSRQKQIRQERARARMMAEIPKADVVLTNPTHFSVALKYDEDRAAPYVIAKGVDHLAMKIREVAREHDVPLYEDPPLARQIYYNVDIDEEVPLELYEAVAKIIAYVYGLKKKTA